MQNIDPLSAYSLESILKIEQLVIECRNVAIQMALEFQAQGFAMNQKPDSTWVTDADLQIEKVLRKKISSAFPTHHILGEEEGGEFPNKGVVWILDPIDGTFSFVNGVPFYSSLIAVCVDGVPVIGSASIPGLGWNLYARKGQGARFNDLPFSPAPSEKVKSEILAIADPYRFRMCGFDVALEKLLGDPNKTRVYPDALGYMLLLRGAVRAFVDPKTEIWDVAPFHVILPECGYSICKWNGRVELSRGSVFSFAGKEPPPDLLQILAQYG
jgi:myo-inositol-1(or 4)-monophosphatase